MPSDRLRLANIRNTTTFRLTSLFGVVFAAGVMTLLGLVYVQTARELTARSDSILHVQANRLLAATPETLPQAVRTQLINDQRGLNYFALFARDGQRVVGDVAMPTGLRINRPTDVWSRSGDHHPLRLLAVRTSWGETILVGRDISPIRDLRITILHILFWSGGVIAVVGTLTGVSLSIGPLRRVRDLQEASRAITHGDLQVRMPITGRNDELDRFAGTVNVMIDEVVRVVAQVKGVTDAVAHDLRTPLTRVRAHLYRAQQSPGISPEFRTVAEQAVGDIDIVLERFAALLRIAEMEAGSRRAGFASTDLVHLIDNIIDLYKPLAEEKGQNIRVDLTPATIQADGKLLFEAVANVLDNSIKFTPEGGRIDLAVRSSIGGPIIEVRDSGPGIPVEERAAVLRRFHRGAAAETIPGSGLGLSVVAAIVHLHRFRLDLGDAKPGLVVRIFCDE